MSKLFEAIKKARDDGESAPVVVDTKKDSGDLNETQTEIELGETQSGMDAADTLRAPDARNQAPRLASRDRRELPGRPARPSVPDRHAAPEGHMVSLIDPHSFEAEQFRALRHIVEERQRELGLRAVGVTSASEGDGKSLVSVNLAGALAQNKDSRVLLIDADLRAPAVNRAVGLRGTPAGLSDVVTSATLDLDDVVIERSTYNLTVLTAGKTPSSPYEVLKSERFASLLDQARARFDFIIVDTPPLLGFPDARIVERLVDGLILVVGAHKTPRKMVDEAVDSIANDKLLGLVFNGDDQPKPYRTSAYYGGRGGSGNTQKTRRSFLGRRRR